MKITVSPHPLSAFLKFIVKLSMRGFSTVKYQKTMS